MRSTPAIRMTAVCAACVCGASAPHASAADAQTYPARPIRLIVPQAPGGSNDIMARYFGGKLAERLGHQIVVDNRPGAEGMIGTDLVAKSSPDGYTMLMTSTAFTMNPAVFKLPYDPGKDFDWATMLGSGPVMITANAAMPVKTLSELVTLAKSKPNYITMASAGGFMHFVSAMFRSHAGFDGVIALYKGGAPALIDVISGQAHVAVPTIPTGAAFVRSGKLKALAVAADRRSPVFPDVPTTIEAGLPSYQASIWWAWGLRAGTPQAILNKLNGEIAAIQKLPETQKRLAAEGAEIVMRTPAEMRTFVPEDMAKWAKVAKDAGMQKM
ncbi:MAG: tripartite tricarboxylate transporter substrate binding protein [Burkholderiales bacterium]|nr:tripartite tricarboxylate transporter substrate binding protein [Burkholderiales bacterium]